MGGAAQSPIGPGSSSRLVDTDGDGAADFAVVDRDGDGDVDPTCGQFETVNPQLDWGDWRDDVA